MNTTKLFITAAFAALPFAASAEGPINVGTPSGAFLEPATRVEVLAELKEHPEWVVYGERSAGAAFDASESALTVAEVREEAREALAAGEIEIGRV